MRPSFFAFPSKSRRVSRLIISRVEYAEGGAHSFRYRPHRSASSSSMSHGFIILRFCATLLPSLHLHVRWPLRTFRRWLEVIHVVTLVEEIRIGELQKLGLLFRRCRHFRTCIDKTLYLHCFRFSFVVIRLATVEYFFFFSLSSVNQHRRRNEFSRSKMSPSEIKTKLNRWESGA